MTGMVCIIGARKGSRRLPGKNGQELHGKPLYQWTLESALSAAVFEHVVFTTDDADIAAAVESFPALLDRRPSRLAGGDVPMMAVVDYLSQTCPEVENAKAVCLLTPCHPFRNAKHIREACDVFAESDARSLMSVTPFTSPPEIAVHLRGRHLTGMPRGRLLKGDYEASYYPDGAVMVFDMDFFREEGAFASDSMAGYAMKWPFSLDIDYPEDLETARLIAPCLLGELG